MKEIIRIVIVFKLYDRYKLFMNDMYIQKHNAGLKNANKISIQF